MMKSMNSSRGALRGGAALQALALLGAGLVVTAVMPTPASAQDYTNVTATGRVVDAQGNGIAGATVTVTSNDQGFTRTATTDSSGTYRVPALPQGSYSFTISAPGQETFTDPSVQLTQSSAGNQFQLGGVATTVAGEDGEVITVTGRRIQVSDFDRTTTGAVIEIGDLAPRVPVARDLTSVVLLAPGTSLGDTAFGNLAAISGSSVSENVFFLNGLNITEFRQGLGAVGVPFEFYNTIEVKNGGIPAEYGRFTGGFVNATTKSGGNEFHGGMLFSWEPDELREDSPNTIIADNSTDQTERLEANFYLSGPIIKDRLFFYALYQARNVTQEDAILGFVGPNRISDPMSPDFNVLPPIYSTGVQKDFESSTSPFFGGKIDAIITDGHRLELTYFDSTQKTYTDTYDYLFDTRDGQPGQVGAFKSTEVEELGGENYIGRYTGQFADWITVSGAYGKNENADIVSPSNLELPFINDSRAGSVSIGNPTNLISQSSDTRTFYRGDVDLYFTALGQHHIKAGYDREKLTSNTTTSYTGDVAWTYFIAGADDDRAPPGTQYALGRTFRNGGIFRSQNEAFYIQDSWSLFDNRLTLNFGVRNDRFENKNVNGETYFESGNQWAPRLSASGDPFGDGRTKVYGSFGRYYLPVPANTNIRLAGAELDFDRYFVLNGLNPDNTPILGAPLLYPEAVACPDTGDLNCDIRSDGQATPTEATVSKSLKPQSVDEFVLGIERNIGERIKVGVFGQYRKLNESLEDVAIDLAVINYCEAEGIAGCDEIWSGFHQYVLTNPGAPATITLSDPLPGETELRTVDFTAEQLGYPKARRTYKAITFTFDREFDGIWSLSSSYTYSKSKGNIEGGIRSDNGQTDSGLTTAFDQPGLTDGTYGYLPGDARHKFKIYGSYQVTDWLSLGGNFSAQSPRRFGCIGRVPTEIDGFAGLYGAAGFYCNVDSNGDVIVDPPELNADGSAPTLPQRALTPRGSVFKSDWQTVTNVTASFKLPTELFNATFRVDVFNLFNQKAELDFRELGTTGAGGPRRDYGKVLSYQTPRYFRFQLGFDF